MKTFHTITVNVFCKQEENYAAIKQKLTELFPFNLEQEKVQLKETSATGLSGNKIKIIEITLDKDRTINKFIENFLGKLNEAQKLTLIRQKSSRMDNELQFFIRLDKEKLLNNEYELTDGGNCYHLKFKMAAFPATKEQALKTIEEVFRKG